MKKLENIVFIYNGTNESIILLPSNLKVDDVKKIIHNYEDKKIFIETKINKYFIELEEKVNQKLFDIENSLYMDTFNKEKKLRKY